jgi:hypothetical protein
MRIRSVHSRRTEPIQRSATAFGDSVRAGRTYRRADDFYLFRGEHGIETGNELGVAIADQETQPLDPIVKVHEQIAGLLGHPRSGRVGRDAREMHRAGAELDEEQDVEPAEGIPCRW